MIIYRDDKAIELTEKEIYDTYREAQIQYAAQDVKQYFENMEEECPFTDDQCIQIGTDALDNLYNCDSYYEDYWEAIREAIEEEI